VTALGHQRRRGLEPTNLTPHDRRFNDPSWHANPLYRRLLAAYLRWERGVVSRAQHTEGDWQKQARARLRASIITGGLAPTNYLLSNPTALRTAWQTHGASLARGARNMARDVFVNRGIPSTVDTRPFHVGGNLACSPGAVVYREPMFEMIQYAPRAPAVGTRPLVMVPPPANRHYILDLAPGRSLVEAACQAGVQAFMIVWRNPFLPEHGRWGLDDHVAAALRAVDVARDITGADQANLLGLCGGGIVVGVALSYLAARGERSVSSATLLATMLVNGRDNVIGTLTPPVARRYLARAAARGKVFSGRALLRTFAWLRPADFVYRYVVDGWLLGRTPAPFDVLAWNADATNAASAMVRDVAEFINDDKALFRGALTVRGTPLDFRAADIDGFHVAGLTDHLVPWRAAHATAMLLGGSSEVVLADAGHILSFVAPPGDRKAGYWADGPGGGDADEWLAGACRYDESWWPRWLTWLMERSGPRTAAPVTLGNDRYRPADTAPGRYVHE
jgi:polyhydroxyalkanoate synthase